MSAEQPSRSVYRISPIRLWSAPGMLIAFALLMFLSTIRFGFDDPTFWSVTLPMVLILLGFAAVSFFATLYSRLVISADGVELYQLGYHLSAPWNNVEAILEQPGHKKPGFVLREPLTGKAVKRLYRSARKMSSGATSARFRMFKDEQLDLLWEGRLIPIDAWAYLLKRGILQDHLTTYAPWVLRG